MAKTIIAECMWLYQGVRLNRNDNQLLLGVIRSDSTLFIMERFRGLLA